jgi:hypothetical protein
MFPALCLRGNLTKKNNGISSLIIIMGCGNQICRYVDLLRPPYGQTVKVFSIAMEVITSRGFFTTCAKKN